MTAYVRGKHAKLVEKNPVVVTAMGYDERNSKAVGEAWPGSVAKYSLRACKKSEAGAVPVLMVEGPEAGQVFYAQPPGPGKKGRAGMKAAGSAAEVLKIKEAGLAARRAVRVIQSVQEWVEKRRKSDESDGSDISEAVVIRLALAFGMQGNCAELLYGGDPWARFADLGKAPDREVLGELLGRVLGVLSKRLGTAAAVRPPVIGEAKKVCGLLGLDFEAEVRAAEKGVPRPKSWEKLTTKDTKGTKKRGKTGKTGKKEQDDSGQDDVDGVDEE